jgi:ABC-type antimicrobial peptide transport system permease subunit
MIRNYFTIGWRTLIRGGGYSVINLFGLTVGMAAAMLIGIWIFHELNYNRSFQNYDRLAQLYHHVTFGNETLTINDVPFPIGAALREQFADFEEVAMTSWPSEQIVRHGDKKLSATAMAVEPAFVPMFSLRILEGSAQLNDVHSILLSKTLASTLIGEGAVGQIIRFSNHDDLTVAGVYEDMPSDSHFAEVKMLVPMSYHFAMSDDNRKQQDSWENYAFQCFVLMNEKASVDSAEARIRQVLYKNASNDGKGLKPVGMLFPMKKWHLYDEFKDGVSIGGQIRYVRMFGVLAIFVLVLACINFTNLSTARSEIRAKEIGLRKVVGSGRPQLVRQFLVESWLITTFSFLMALVIVWLSLPWFSEIAGKEIRVPLNLRLFIMSLAFIILTGVLAGAYPAFYLSSFRPVKVLRGTFKAGRFAAIPRKVLVVFQFTVSIVIAVGTMVIFLEIRHVKDRPVGFDREGIFHLAIRTERLASADYNSLRYDLLATGVVENMAKSDYPVTGSMSATASITWEGKDPSLKPLIAMNSCSHDFPETNGFQFVEGRDFSRAFSTDSAAVIVNEMAARLISKDDVIGKMIRFNYGKDRQIIGVIKDQVRWGPFVKQSPHLYYINYDGMGYLTVRLKKSVRVKDALKMVAAVISKYDDEALFDYKFLDDDYARQFENEERIGGLARAISLLAALISCIGILGLAAFATNQRKKEIGIRKVLGASALGLWRMLSGDFLRLVMISIVLGLPLAYYTSDQWLQRYDYRIAIPWTVFIITAVLAIVATLAAVSYQALKAALANPVGSLKND